MSLDWYPAIRECCAYWPTAPMLQQTFESLDKNFNEENDACIDCSKAIIEVICRIIIDELDDPTSPAKPKSTLPSFADWVSAAIRTLKLGNNRNDALAKLISQHHKLTTELGLLRNEAGPISHGKEGFIERLSTYHRRTAVLSADAIVAFLHQAYLEAELNLERTREPYQKFQVQNNLIDTYCTYTEAEINEDGLLQVTVELPDEAGQFLINATPSELLFLFDRTAYIEALNAARSAKTLAPQVKESDL